MGKAFYNEKVLLKIFILIMIPIIFSIICSKISNSIPVSQGLKRGDILPIMNLTGINEDCNKIQNIGEERTTIILIMNLDCDHCLSSLKLLRLLPKMFSDYDLEIKLIFLNRPERIYRYLNENEIPLKMYYSKKSMIERLKEPKVPITYLIDNKRRILKKYLGMLNINEIRRFLQNRCKSNCKNPADQYFGGNFIGTKEVIFQKGLRECGVASLRMVFTYYGIRSDYNEIARKILTHKGTSMLRIKNYANSKGLNSQNWLLEWDDLIYEKPPMILHLKHDHFVVFSGMKNQKVLIKDPSAGILNYSKEKFMNIWSGKAVKFKRIKPMGKIKYKEI